MSRQLLTTLLLLPFLVSALPATTDSLESPTLIDRRAGGVISNCKNKGQFALTYDDGVWQYESQLSQYLTKQNVTGTFFVNGNNYGCIYDQEYADALKSTYKRGHLIASHTWSHPDITTLSDSEFTKQLVLMETALKKILGIKPKYFRPPYGNYNSANLRVLAKRGYIPILWSFDSGDSVGSSPSESNAAYDKLAKGYPSPVIALNHETEKGTVDTVTPHAIKVLKKAGYKLVSVAECLGDDAPYQSVGKPSARDSTWTCEGTPSG